MKSAEEWIEDAKTRPFAFSAMQDFITAIQRDARAAGIREAAVECTKFLVGDPANGIPLRSPMPSECADRILALIEKDAPA